ncbi:alpha/beta fold hydrolase [Pigmentibacter ruber]|uniref:alpha/beta fold hydrolase n=1 Tax=Pigmentibacter ruber TaxID=2683196 RepID=UPI00131C696D|nr:alpha/beta hydrolase [Pigmentibacter ruber]BFD31682.1 alpha/beta fold hydrolase [Pigmentibacter ruber]
MSTMIDRYILINGYKTRYWKIGEAKSILLLLHGFAFSIEIWEHNISELSKYYTVIALDLLGFGLTDKPKKRQKVEIYPQFVYDFLNALGVDQTHLVGHSMGGLIATRFSELFPEKVLSLTLISSAGFSRKIPIHFRIFSLPFVGEFFIKPNKRGLFSALRRNVYHQNLDLSTLANKLYTYSLHPEMGKTLLNVCRAAINIFGFKRRVVRSITKDVGKIRAPVLIIWGKNDIIIYVSHAIKAHKLIKNSQLSIFDACGHLPQFEYPKKFNDLLLNFISNK